MIRSRAVRFVARLLIFTLYLNGLGPMLPPPSPLAAASVTVSAASSASASAAALPAVAASAPAKRAVAPRPVAPKATATPPAIAPEPAPAPAPVTTTRFDGGGSGTSGSSVSLFGPKRYTRTSGSSNYFTESITVPNWMRSPYIVRIKNGESDGSHRVTGAYISLSGLFVATPFDFNQNTDTVDRPALLIPILVQLLGLSVTIFGPTGSYVTITVIGRSGDTTAPSLTITAPAANTTTSDNTPDISLTYADTDTTDCHASGIDTATLKVTLDGVDRTSLFAVTATGAQATIPDTLALSDGAHALHVEIRDRGGNLTTADRTFSVHTVTEPPTITITSPAAGALVSHATLSVSGTVVGHGTPPLGVVCSAGSNSADATITNGTWSCQVPLQEGENAVLASATDSGGTSEDSRKFVLDSTRPAISITSPTADDYFATSTATVTGTVSDDHDVTVTVNGVAATVTGSQFTATVPVSPPSTVLTAIATDAAGNTQVAQGIAKVVTGDLTLTVTSPACGSYVKGPHITVRGTTNSDLPVTIQVNSVVVDAQENGTWQAPAGVLEGAYTLHIIATDNAHRTKELECTLNVDSVTPAITITAPAPGSATNGQNVHVAGNINDASRPITLTVNGQTTAVADNGDFATDVPARDTDGSQTITIVATDPAGNSTTATAVATVDRTIPTFTVDAPAAGAVIGNLPYTVMGTATDATATTVTVDTTVATPNGSTWQASFPTLPEGSHTFTITAVDAAGNSAPPQSVTVTVDTVAPVLTITSPASGTVTPAATLEIAGTVTDTTTVTLAVTPSNASTVVTVANGQFTITGIPLGPDGDQTITLTATDSANHPSTLPLVVTRDNTAPQIDLTAPDRITRRQSDQVITTTVNETNLVDAVVKINGVVAGTFTTSTFTVPLTVPDGLAIGDTFSVSVKATDRAGNATTVSHDVRVAADSALVGHVLSDTTGRPIENATVHIGTQQRTTDAQGRYTLPTEQSSISLSAEFTDMTSVSRVVSMATGSGTMPVDARLTPLAAKVAIAPAGGQLTALSTVGSGPSASGSTGGTLTPTATDPVIAIIVPATALGGSTAQMQLTPLSAQGLPDLLPLGWSPIAAFDVRSDVTLQDKLPLQATFTATQAAAFGSSTLALVVYRPLLHAWIVAAKDLQPSNGVITAQLPGAGAFALVIADVQAQAIPVGDIDTPLTGVTAVTIPVTASSQGSVEPAVIPPTGGTARGQLRVDSPLPLPSGTLVQAEITETFTLPSNQVASEEQRRADIVLYRAPGRDVGTAPPADSAPAVSGTVPITPSRTFDPASLVEGHVHLDIFAGRESVRGATGGKEAVTVTADDARLVIPAGALANDTAVSLQHVVVFSFFLPTHAALTPLSELVVDVPGAALNSPAELSIATSAATQVPNATFVIARVERVDGVAYLTVVASAEVSGDRLIARAVPGLPGVSAGGRYVFYRVDGTVGFITGTVRAGDQSVAAVVTTDSLPFIARPDTTGHYMIAALAGGAGVTVTARVPRSSLETHETVTVVAGTPTTKHLNLAATATIATVTPRDGARGVSREPQITVTTTAPIVRETVTAPNAVKLWKIGQTDTAVAVNPVLAGSGQTLSIVPKARLDADTQYRLDITGLTDTYGGDIAVPVTTFRTAAQSAPSYSTDDLTFSFPDSAGVVTITAPAGKFPLGTQFLIINNISGQVLSMGTLNDGSVNATIRATLNDQLVITITDPDGRVTTATRSRFIDVASGRTAIGSAGGEVNGPGGTGLRIPEGALDEGAIFTLSTVEESAFPTRPDAQDPDTHFGSGLKITSPSQPFFRKEVDLVFKLPDEVKTEAARLGLQPKDAFFYVYRRISGPNGKTFYETIDYAEVEGTGDEAKVVTASCPFPGVINTYSLLGPAGALTTSVETMYLMLWTIKVTSAGRPTKGMITGWVKRPEWDPGAPNPVYRPVKDAPVWGVDSSGVRLEDQDGGVMAITQEDGRYSLFDNRFLSGPVTVHTNKDGAVGQATVYAAEHDVDVPDPCISRALQVFPNVAYANITLPAVEPPPPAPAIKIRTMRMDNDHRVDTRGLVVSGTPLIIGVDAGDADVLNIAINREGAAQSEERSFATQHDPALQQSPRDPLAMPFIMSEQYTPSLPSTYRITATALPSFGPSVTSSITIRVLANSGGVDTDQNAPPAVISAQTVPAANATGVPTNVFLQVAFTEPVRHIPGQVTLYFGDVEDDAHKVGIKISGVRVNAQGEAMAIDNVDDPSQVVTSLTIQPELGLAYGTRYKLKLGGAIEDLDTPTSQQLTPWQTTFTTFGPEPIGNTEEQFASAGMVVLGDRAFTLETTYGGGVGGNQSGVLRVFNVADPVAPKEVLPPTQIDAAPRDIAGEETTIVVATLSHMQFVPGPTLNTSDIASGSGNLLVYDVSGETPVWVGAASLTDNIQDGSITRVVVKDQIAYVATVRKGVQIVDLTRTGLGELANAQPFEQYHMLYAPGEGVNHPAVIATIPVIDPARPDLRTAAWLNDLKVGDYMVDGTTPQRLVLGTGYPEAADLVIVDPLTASTFWQGALRTTGHSLHTEDGSMATGQAIALAKLKNRNLAIVGGYGTIGDGGASGVIAIVDMTPVERTPRGNPQVIAWIALSHAVGDILMMDDKAIVSSPTNSSGQSDGLATIINLADPFSPTIAGTLMGVGTRLARGNAPVLFSQDRRLITHQGTELDAIRSTAFGVLGYIPPAPPSFTRLNPDRSEEETVRPVPITLTVYPRTTPVATARLTVFVNGVASFVSDVAMSAGQGVYTLAKGFKRTVDSVADVTMEFIAPDGTLVQSQHRKLELGYVSVRVDSNNDTQIGLKGSPMDDLDDQAEKVGRPFQFWEADPWLQNPDHFDPTAKLIDYAGLVVRLTALPDPNARVALRWRDANWRLYHQTTLADTKLPAAAACRGPNETGPSALNAVNGKLRFCDQGAANMQVAQMKGDYLVPTVRPFGIIEIPSYQLTHRENAFLFACIGSEFKTEPACPGPFIEVGQLDANGNFEALNTGVRVDVKPFSQLTDLVSARRADDVTEQNPDHFKVTSEIHKYDGTPAEAPSANIINLFTHGFSVSHREWTTGTDESGESAHFPSWAKRFYWAGQPILEEQGARTIGLEWPGDFHGINPIPLRDAREPYFPDDEFNAFQVGIPLGKYLNKLRAAAGQQLNIFAHSLGNIAMNSGLQHMPQGGSTKPIVYTMHEAALTAEAFDAGYVRTDVDRGKNDLLIHAMELGYAPPETDPEAIAGLLPDKRWADEKARIEALIQANACTAQDPVPDEVCLLTTDPGQNPDPQGQCARARLCGEGALYLRHKNSVSPLIQNPAPAYDVRWSQPVHATLYDHGPWRGVFATNRTLNGVKIFNSYNQTDWILRIDAGENDIYTSGFGPDHYHAWYSCQLLAKPFVDNVIDLTIQGLFTGGTDSTLRQKWIPLMKAGASINDATLQNDQKGIWPLNDQGQSTAPPQWPELTRRWAELAYWFPALASPAGTQPLTVKDNIVGNVELTQEGGDKGLQWGTTLSHSFMRVKPFSEVWTGYVKLQKTFATEPPAGSQP